MLLKDLMKRGIIKGHEIPSFLRDNTHYLVMMGSVAYGVAEDYSDRDVYGWAIPPKDMTFPHLAGNIRGFGKEPPNFEVWQQHHIKDPTKNREYDMSIYGVCKYFNLVMENNPNMLDSMFVPENCILHCSPVAQRVRENRHLFLHKGVWHKLKGYAYQQLRKCKKRDSEPVLYDLLVFEDKYGIHHTSSLEEGAAHLVNTDQSPEAIVRYSNLFNNVLKEKRRAITTKIHGYDTKFAYHVVRLMDQAEEILRDGTLTLDRKDRREMLKAIRRGDWKFSEIEEYFKEKESSLTKLYESSSLRYAPDEAAIKKLLIEVLDSHYGDLKDAIVTETDDMKIRADMDKIYAIAKGWANG